MHANSSLFKIYVNYRTSILVNCFMSSCIIECNVWFRFDQVTDYKYSSACGAPSTAGPWLEYYSGLREYLWAQEMNHRGSTRPTCKFVH